MIVNTFHRYFRKVTLPSGYLLESSRIFVDKEKLRSKGLKKSGVSLALYLEMIKYARGRNYDGIITLVSYQMLRVLKLIGWGLDIINEGLTETNEKVFIITLFVDVESEREIRNRLCNLTN